MSFLNLFKDVFVNLVISLPSKKTCPEVAFSKCKIVLPRVVFPQPDSPTKPMVSPLKILKETLLTAFTT